jgi:peptidoglycan/xylan/chitin deacetylase (PgdA/CDA1 family)
MKARIRQIIRNCLEPHALVLMYHRVAKPEADLWEISVSPENFEAQLQVLKHTANVIQLPELVENLKQKKVKKNTIAITFDDGYVDNITTAKPLLEKYDLPATFFITSSNIGRKTEFWWDELENLILFSPQLPPSISLTINNRLIETDLRNEALLSSNKRQLNCTWKACSTAPPTIRCQLYYQLWELLKPLPYQTQKEELQKIREWVRWPENSRTINYSMSHQQLEQLGKCELFEIGAHTNSHAALGCHSRQEQQQEILLNRQFLKGLTGRESNLLSYPYGNYNQDTLLAAATTGFSAAFTTEEQVIRYHSDPYKLGRFQVKDIPAESFEKQLLRKMSPLKSFANR